jgi:hypothetical protein
MYRLAWGHGEHSKQVRGPMQKIIELILALLIIGVALAFGGVQPIAYSLMQVGVFLCLLLPLFNQLRSGKAELPLSLWPLLFILVVVMQLVSLPASQIIGAAPGQLWKHRAG